MKCSPIHGLALAAALCCASCAAHRAGNGAARHTVVFGNGATVQNGGAQAKPMMTAFERQIQNARDAGDGDLTLRILRERVAANPDDLKARLALARQYEQSGAPELAVDHLRLAAERFPESGEVQLALAKSLRRIGLTADAAKGLEAFATAHPPNSPELSSWVGILRDENGDWKGGEAAHRAALALAPGDDRLHNNLGYNLLRQKRYPEAAEEFRSALAIKPDSVVARNNLGLALAAEPKDALRELQHGNDPATAHSNLAAALIEQGRLAEARKELEIALGYERNHPAALTNLKLVSELEGRPATLPPGGPAPAWRRVVSTFWRGLVGSDGPPDKGQGASASQ